MSVLEALGDSLTCGEGVGVSVPLHKTWTALLADGLRFDHVSHAVAGSRTRDVRAEQLPLVERAAVSTLLVGLNDVARTGFDAYRIRTDLLRCVERLTAVSGVVVLGRLHDPARVLHLPRPLATWTRRRLAVVNEVIDEAGTLGGVRVLDLEVVPELRHPSGWAVDRVHPSEVGHAGIACAAGDLLGISLPRPAPVRAPGRLARSTWCARHGAPYLAGQLVGTVVRSTARRPASTS